MMHGTEDTIVPYVNGKKVFTQAQNVGLPSDLITMDGAGHVPWDYIMQEQYFNQMLNDMVQGLDLTNAEKPDGCDNDGSQLFLF